MTNSKSDHKEKHLLEAFLTKAAHGLQAPLASIIGYSEILSSTPLSTEDTQLYARTLQRNATYILQLIDSMLDVTRFQSEEFKVNETAYNLKDLCSDVCDMYRSKAEKKGISLGIETTSPLPQTIQGDVLRLKRVILNLIDNAVNHTKEGGVKIVLSFSPESKVIEIKVVDTGTGMSNDQLEILHRERKSGKLLLDNSFEEIGVGLWISEELMNRMGGSMEFASTQELGTIVTISLPIDTFGDHGYSNAFTRAKESIPKIKVFPTLIGHILLIDNDNDLTVLVQNLLESWGISVTVTEDGKSGLAFAQSGEYDLIIIEEKIPLLPGPQVVSLLRESAYEKPILTFSTERDGDNNTWSKEHNVSGVIPMPFRQEELYAIMQRYLPAITDANSLENPIYSTLLDQGKMYRSVLDGFVKILPARLKIIRAAITENDHTVLALELEKLSRGDAFGYPLLTTIVRSFKLAVQAEDSSEIFIRLAELEKVIKRIIDGTAPGERDNDVKEPEAT